MKQRQVHVRQAGSARHRRSLTGVLAMFGILVGTVVAIVGGTSVAPAGATNTVSLFATSPGCGTGWNNYNIPMGAVSARVILTGGGGGGKLPAQPAAGSAFLAGCAALHVVHRVKVRVRGVGRAAGLHHCKLPGVPNFLERAKRRVQAEKAVELDRAAVGAGLANRHAAALGVVVFVAVRHHHIQAIGTAALEDADQHVARLLARRC